MEDTLITLDNLRHFKERLGTTSGKTDCIYKGSDDPTETNPNIQYWLDTSVSPALLKYKDEQGGWDIIAGGGGGSSGGDSSISQVTLNPDWTEKTLSYGNDCIFTFDWKSVRGDNQTGMGTFYLYVTTAEGEELKESYKISQPKEGEKIPVNLTSYLALGDNEVIIRVKDRYGTIGEAILSIKTVKLSLTESFNESMSYNTPNIAYHCTPSSGIQGKEKYMYVLLDNEIVVNGEEVKDDNEMQTYHLKVATHGTHSIKAYFTVELENGEFIPSDEVYSEFAYISESDTTPVLTTNCGIDKLEEFDSVNIPWYVFTPNGDGTVAKYTPLVEIYESNQLNIPEGATPKKIVENAEYGVMQEYIFKAEKSGTNYILFKVGDYVRPVIIEVEPSSINVSAVNTNLQLYLTPRNQVQGNSVWVSETVGGRIEATLEKFNFESDGWLTDDSGKSTVLRLSDEAKLHIPVEIFTDTVKTTGLTVEFEIATHNVLDYETEIIKCMNSGIGISVKANQATLKTKENTITTPFREGEQVRVSFVIDQVTKLLLIYINGVMSGATYYNEMSDDFAQSVVQGITVGSNLCTTDIYAIRVYGTGLNRRSILNNWIADTQDKELLVKRYKRNNVFGNNGLHPDNLPENLPYLVFFASEDDLPQAKGVKKYLNGKFVDPSNPERSFTFTNAQVKVQGTSSSGYPRKNFTLTFDEEEGIVLIETGERKYVFKIDEDNSLATNSFCFKADYASSEGANNVELVKLFNDICTAKTPPQLENDKVRQGIDGFPMVIFCYHDNAYYFVGKYNFNNDKGTPEVYGMKEGVESWEVTGNGTPMGEYKEDDFDTPVFLPDSGTWTEKWLRTFEARYPDKHDDYENLQEMVSWVRSTWRDEADEERLLIEPVTYGDKTYEYDNAEYRQAKFINEAPNYFDVKHLCFFYLFTDFFLMVDNREKNTFPTRYFNKELNKWLWYFLPYDFDTALGINNSGELVFGHGLEDVDEGVYNGADSVLWCNVRDYFADEIETMYCKLRDDNLLTYDDVVKRFTDHQKLWGEAIFNEDSYYKYIAVMFGEEGTTRYLAMLQGNKEAQRNHWLYNRFKYYDSKYLTRDALTNPIIIRPNANEDIVITPYTDTYFAINFDKQSGDDYKPTPQRAFKGIPVSFSNPDPTPQNAVVHIYNASQITDLGDLSGQDTSEFDGKGAVRLQRLIIGSDDFINDKFYILSLGSNKLLKLLNVKNCPKLANGVDIGGCSGIEEVYFEGTSITSLNLPRGGSLRVLHLPETVNNLTVINHKVTEFYMPNYNNLSTLWLELNETSKSTFNLKAILNAMLERLKASEEGELGRLRVTGFELTGDKGFETAQELIDFYKDLHQRFRGMDANGNASQEPTYLKNMLEGKIEVAESPILGTQLKEMQEMFPRVEIIVKQVVSTIYFYEDKEHTRLFSSQNVKDNGNANEPTITLGKVPTYYAPTTANNGGTEDELARYVWKGTIDINDEARWSDSLNNVTIDRHVHAVYRKDLKYYRSFLDKDGNYIAVNGKERNFYYAFDGENEVIEPPDQEDYVVEHEDGYYKYFFKGWIENGSSNQPASKQVKNIETGDSLDVVYVPAWDVKRVNMVRYYDGTTEIGNGTTYLSGETLIQPEDPTKEWDNNNTYTFSHWTLEDGTRITDFNDVSVTSDMNIYAIFDPHTIYYTVRFKKHYGDVMQTLPNTYPYSTDYGDMYTGDTAWEYNSPKFRKEELKGWRVNPVYENGTYYLDYVASLYVEEQVSLSVGGYNSGANNTGETSYVCDNNESTSRGFNIGVADWLQIHHFIRLRAKLANDVPDGTVFNDISVIVKVKKKGYKDGINYPCRFRCYLGYYSVVNVFSLTSTSYLVNGYVEDDDPISLNKSTLSNGLTFMTNNNYKVNSDDIYVCLEGSNIYVKETYCTIWYTT